MEKKNPVEEARRYVDNDKKLLTMVNTGYETMHIHMGYDGTRMKDTCDGAFRMANDIIDRCATMLN